MIYLIDGHNLIGKMPDIKLSDPDDEERMVTRLQNWARLDRKRKIEVVFDAGSHGGFGDLLSGLNVNVRFSRMGQTADAVLIRQIKGIRNPQEYTLISSDREIISVAKKRRLGYILSEEFVMILAEDRAAMRAQADEDSKKPPDVSLAEDVEVSDEEVDEWLDTFAKAPKRERPPIPQIQVKPKKEEPPLPTAKKRPPASTEDLKAGEASLTREELSDWMAMFGDAPKPKAKDSDEGASVKGGKRPSVKRPPPDPHATPDDKFSQKKLSSDEVDEWLNWFGEGNS